MRIVCISDTHERHAQVEVPPGDILIHGGDFTMVGRLERVKQFSDWLESVREDGGFRHVIVIAGNHDLCFDPRNFSYIPGVSTLLGNATYLDDSGCQPEGLKIWGSPISPQFLEWAFMRQPGEDIRRHWNMIPEDTDVLITHTPPLGILDQPTPQSPGVGCADLLEKVKEVRPKLHVFGHIHGGYGIKKIDGTVYVNASLLDEAYKVANEPVVVEL